MEVIINLTFPLLCYYKLLGPTVVPASPLPIPHIWLPTTGHIHAFAAQYICSAPTYGNINEDTTPITVGRLANVEPRTTIFASRHHVYVWALGQI